MDPPRAFSVSLIGCLVVDRHVVGLILTLRPEMCRRNAGMVGRQPQMTPQVTSATLCWYELVIIISSWLDVRARWVDIHAFRKECNGTLKRDVPEEF